MRQRTGVTRQRTDIDVTDRRLKLLVGLVVFVAAAALVDSVRRITVGPPPTPRTIGLAFAVAFLIAVARGSIVRVRIRATKLSTHWADAAIIVGLTILPTPWVAICTTVGTAVTVILMRLSHIKIAFNVAKDTLVAVAAGTTLALLGPVDLLDDPATTLWRMGSAYLVAVVLDDLCSIPVIALATRTSLGRQVKSNWDMRLVSLALRFGVAVMTLAILDMNLWLLIAVPPLVLCLHLWHSARLRTRAERTAWQQLAAATDALNVVDLDTVLRSATKSASELFSTDYVEVELWLDEERRLFRSDGETVLYDGAPAAAPPDPATATIVRLDGYEGGPDIGVLRLRFRGQVALNEREDYTLHTFASALCTALRNACAYAQLARLAQQNAHDATHDPLTGLPNRRKLLDQGTTLLDSRANRGGIALMLIDLNHFKEVNDTLGHSAGDRVLTEIADRLRTAAGPDTLVARLGGDEFAVLFSGLPAPALAAHRAEELLGSIHDPINLEGMRISVEASAGIATAAATGGVGEMLRRADIAMYQAKRSGQRIASFTRSRDTADVGQLALGGDLARAMADNEFTVSFQPIVNLASGEVISAEALARWHHPDRGNLDPHRFLHAVERSGLLASFSQAVLDQALVAAHEWADAGFEMPVAVNVSPRSLLDRTFPAMVLDRLETRGFPPERLILELTETLTISQLEVVDQVLGELRAAGVRLALDDFGTRYSSLSVLSRIPVHELKIDQAFVREMDSSTEAAAVVRSTVDLGRGLGLVVVAEGVESASERHRLWEMGCVAGQGHLFLRPQPADRLLAALQRGSGGRPGTLAPPLHQEGSVIRLPAQRRSGTGSPTPRASRPKDERQAR